MYARYAYPANYVHADLMNDLVKIITGTTDKTQLSTVGNSTLQTATSINGTIPAGWTKHSTTWSSTLSTTNASVVLRAPWHTSNIDVPDASLINDPLQYKYAELLINNTALLSVAMAERATQESPAVFATPKYVSTTTLSLPKTSDGIIYIYATAQCIVLLSQSSTTFATVPIMLCERNRLSPWDTNTAGYPPILSNGGTLSTYFFSSVNNLRLKNFSGNDVINSNYPSANISPYVITGATLRTVKNADGEDVHLLCPIIIGQPQIGFLGGEISTLCELWQTTSDFGRMEDELVVSGKTYVIFTQGSTTGAGVGPRFAARIS